MNLKQIFISLAFLALVGCGTPATDSSSVASSEPVSSASESSISSSSESSISSVSSVASESSSVASSSSEPEVAGFCPADEPCRILPAGDSITEGIGSSDNGAWRTELFRVATESGYDITFVGTREAGPQTVAGVSFPRNHEGVSGDQILASSGFVGNLPGLSARIAETTPAPGAPHIILIHIGTNEVYGNDPGGYIGRLENLLDDLIEKNPDTLIGVASLTPLDNQDWQNTVNDYNSQIPGVVQARADAGKNVIFIDIASGYPAGQLADGVHPNDTGYNYMGQTFYNAIETYLN